MNAAVDMVRLDRILAVHPDPNTLHRKARPPVGAAMHLNRDAASGLNRAAEPNAGDGTVRPGVPILAAAPSADHVWRRRSVTPKRMPGNFVTYHPLALRTMPCAADCCRRIVGRTTPDPAW